LNNRFGTELQTPPPDALVRDDHAALGQHQFHIPKAQTEDVIEPDRVADQFGWDAVAIVRICRLLHVSILAHAALPSPDPVTVTIPVGGGVCSVNYNWATLLHAKRQVYARDDTFKFMLARQGKIKTGRHVLRDPFVKDR